MTSTSRTDNSVRIGTIVVAVDGSHHADHAITWAAEEARVHERPLTVVHVERVLGAQERGWLAQAGIPLQQITDEMRTDSEEMTHRAHALAVATAPGIEVDTMVRSGDARAVLLEMAARADMVVVGSRGRGPVSSLLLGSVSIDLSRRATCPVAVIRPPADGARPRGVVVGTEGSGRSVPTLEVAFREASCHRLPLTVVHGEWEALGSRTGWSHAVAADPFFDAAQARISGLLSGLRDKFPDVDVSVEITKGLVDQCLADLSRTHRLTVLGRHARTLLERFGSMSLTTSIVEHSSGPVLVVP